jgi:hypothetical protein
VSAFCVDMETLPDPFIKKLADSLDGDNTLGVTLVGSFARGEGGPYSDVDLWLFVRQEAGQRAAPVSYEYQAGRLVTVKTTTLEKEYSSLQNPRKALWTIPALRQSRILLDQDGSIAALKIAAETAAWEPLQKAADAFASSTLASTSEEIHKILDGLARLDESKTAFAIWGVTQNLSEAILVQRGMFVPTENVYLDRAQEAAGRTSGWTRQFRLALGLDPLPPGEPTFIGYGQAGLRLFRETAGLLQDILQPEDARIVDLTLKILKKAGYE